MEFLRCFPIDDGVRAKILFRQWFGSRHEGGGNNGGEYNKRANERSAVCGFFKCPIHGAIRQVSSDA